MLPTIPEARIIQAATAGTSAFFDLISEATLEAVGGTLDAATMSQLSGEQVTMLAYRIFRNEMLEGGYIQLIHNGYGPFIFLNPFAKAMRLWGDSLEPDNYDNTLHVFSRQVYKARKLFEQHEEAITHDMDDEAFMALYEQFPDFDPLDDDYVDNEEDITAAIATYIDNNIHDFVVVDK